MQSKNRVYDKDLRRFIYPQQQNYERESNRLSLPRNISPYPSNYPRTTGLNFQYAYPLSGNYFQNREMNRNALGYPRDQGQISALENNKIPLSYMKKIPTQESKIYHYSIASKREYNQDIEEDTSSGQPTHNPNLNEIKYINNNNFDRKNYIIDYNNNKYKKFLSRKKEENILPTKVFISDTYPYNNKDNQFKSRPSREKDNFKGGVINLNKNNKYSQEDVLRKINLIQKWWKKYLSNKNQYGRFSNNAVNRTNTQNNKYIVQTTRVEVFKRDYISIPLIRPEIITKKYKVNFDKKIVEDNDNLEIILDKDSLKQNMANIWNEDNMCTLNESLSFIRKGKNTLKGTNIKKFEDEIEKLKLALDKKEQELNYLTNKLKNFENKKPNKESKIMKIQLVDNLYIKNYRINKTENQSIESNDNFEIIPIEKEPLKKQLIDSLFIKNIITKMPIKIQSIFPAEKTIQEERDNIEIQPIEKEPLKKQLVDDLYIGRILLIKPENIIQNTDILTISKINKAHNSIETLGSLEISPVKKAPLQKQIIDSLYIEKFPSIKPKNIIQKIDKLSLFRVQKPQNIFESIDNIEISFKEEKNLERQLIDELYIENHEDLRPENQIQNIDQLSLFNIDRTPNSVETEYCFELLPKEKEPLKKQLVDDLYIGKTIIIKPQNEIQNIDKINISEKESPTNVIEEINSIAIESLVLKPLQMQLIEDLFIEKTLIKPKIELQNIDKITISQKPNPINIIEEINSIEIESLVLKPLQIQLIDDLFIEKTLKKPQNELQNIDKITILQKRAPINSIEEIDNIEIEPLEKMPLEKQIINDIFIEKTPYSFKDLIIEGIDNMIILKNEKDPLEYQVIDSLSINALEKSKNEIQQTYLMTILKTEKKPNSIESLETIFIPPKEKEPLSLQVLDDLFIEKTSKPENVIQYLDKIALNEISKPKNNIEQITAIIILPKEKEQLILQGIDSMLIEKLNPPENEIISLDKFVILKEPKKELIIEEQNSIFIPKKDKPLLEHNYIDSLFIEGDTYPVNEKQNIDEITLIKISRPKNEISENYNIYISSKEKEQLIKENRDDIFIEEIAKKENQIQLIDKLNINSIKRPENIIQENASIFIPKKDKPILENINIDNITIESLDKAENLIQNIDKIELNQIDKPEKIMQKTEYIFIPPEEKAPYEFQSVDNLLILGNSEEIKIQQIEHFTIVKNFKISNRIDKMDDIYIPRIEKGKLSAQTIDSLIIEGDSLHYEENDIKVQEIDKINILKNKKKQNNIEQINSIFIPPKMKNVLKIQQLGELMIEKEPKYFEYIIQGIDNIIISEKEKDFDNYIAEVKESICLFGNKKSQKNKEESIDNIFIDSTENNVYVIENVEKMDILRNKKQENNIIENINDIFIEPKEKEKAKLSPLLAESILIERNPYPDNIAQIIDNIKISQIQSPANQIEAKESIYIPSKQKEALSNKSIDSILIEASPKEENKIQLKDKIELKEMPKPENQIEAKESILIKPNIKEKHPLIRNQGDSLMIEGKEKPEEKIQYLDSIKIVLPKKFEEENILIEQGEKIDIIEMKKPEKKYELKKEVKDSLLIEEINKNGNNKIVLVDKIEINQINKPENEIEKLDDIVLINEIKQNEEQEFKLFACDELFIKGLDIPQNEIQKIENIEIIKANKSLLNEINYIDSIYISSKEPNPFINQNIDNIAFNEIIKPSNEIQAIDEFEIKRALPQSKEITNIIESNINFIIKSKTPEHLEKQILDNLFIKSKEKPEISIQKLETLDIIGTKNIFIQNIAQGVSFQINPTIIEKPEPEKDNIIQSINQISLKEINKPKNEIESNTNIYIKPKDRNPLEYQKINSLFIEETLDKNYEIQKVYEIQEIKEGKKIIENNIIEKNINFVVLSKKKDDLEYQILDRMLFESLPMPEIEMQKAQYFTIEKNKKNLEDIIPVNDINMIIKKKDKEPLKKQLMDELFIEKTKNEKNRIEIIVGKRFKILGMPKKENVLELQNNEKIFYERLIPTFKDKKCTKESQESLNILKQEKSKPLFTIDKYNLDIKSIPQKKVEYKIQEAEKINLDPQDQDITEEYIQEIINFKNIDDQKLHGKNKKKIILVEEKMPDLFFKGKDKEKDIEPKIKIEDLLVEKKVEYFTINKEKKEIIKPENKINNRFSLFIDKEKISSDKLYLLFLQSWKDNKIKPQKFIIQFQVHPEEKEKKNFIIQKPFTGHFKGNILPHENEDIKKPKTDQKILIPKKVLNIFIPKEIYKPKIIPELSDTKIQFWVKGKQRKSFIIENKGYFIINSSPRISENLIVRGTCFSLGAKPRELELVSQDFEVARPKSWNQDIKVQKSQYFNIHGIDNKLTWMQNIKRQKCVKFGIPKEIKNKNDLLFIEKRELMILAEKSFEQEIKKNDYNYQSFEKDKEDLKDNNKKIVANAKILKINKIPKLDDSEEEFDPFSCCKKREKKEKRESKLDKFFQERKTNSEFMKENNDINNEPNPFKAKNNDKLRIKKDNDEYNNPFIDNSNNKERKTDIIIRNVKNNDRYNRNSNKTNPAYKNKTKKIEYLRDDKNNQKFFN